MEIFQEPTFTAFLAVVLTFIAAKIVSFAISNSNADDSAAICSINEGPAAKEATLSSGLRVKRSKDKRKVKFVDDVVIRRVDRHERSENREILDDIKSVVDKIVEEEIEDVKSSERVDQLGENGVSKDLGEKITEEKCYDTSQDKGSEGVEREGDGSGIDGVFGENKKSLETSGVKSEISDEWDNEVELEDANNNVIKEGSDVVGSDDDDWEGIERSDLERVFAEAVNYLEYGGKGKDKEDDHLAKLGSDVQMELYGLHKVAVEGPCNEPQPMALKVSARAKWNAWQRLGSMNQDVAMEQYIRVLSDNVPIWMHDYSTDNDIRGSRKLETIGTISDPEFERKLELKDTPVSDSSGGDKDDTV